MEKVQPHVIGPPDQLFDLITPSMRPSKILNSRQGAPKWPTGSAKGSNSRFLGAPVKVVREKNGRKRMGKDGENCDPLMLLTA